MELFLLRHGHAETEAATDSQRSLSEMGKAEVRQSVENDKNSLARVQRIIVSPFLRAQQSADIACKVLGDVARFNSELLLPNADPSALVNHMHTLYHRENINSILLVGHRPLLGIMLDSLSGSEPGRYRLATASLAAMDAGVMAKGCCEIRWLHHVSHA